MISPEEVSNATVDYFINLKQTRAKILTRLKARNRLELANKRTELFNFAESVNSKSPVVHQLTKAKVNPDDFPTHIALVPDGNRRWANDRQLSVGEGYASGAEKIKGFRKWSMVDNDVDVVSAFLMSTENIKRRPEDELAQLYGVFTDFFNGVAENDLVHQNRIKHEVRGNKTSMELLPDEVLDAIDNMEAATSDYNEKKMVFLMPYGSRDSIVKAARQTPLKNTEGQLTVTEKGEDDTEFRDNLLLGDLPDVDLLLRTSEERMSNFMMYESAYAEIIFKDMMWPSYNSTNFYEDMYRYSTRDRRFGV